MRIAVIGAGISGLVSAHVLSRKHEVVIFEANDYVGGHTHTHDVSQDGQSYAIDTGFIVFNERNYPNFTTLLGKLGVPYQDTSMSFSVRCDRTGLEYNGTSINRLFAQRRNLLRPRFYGMVIEILRFGREAPALLESDSNPTLAEYLLENEYSRPFVDHYLMPMVAALWSAPFETIREFPARSLISFFHNHGMLQVSGRPQWKVVQGGSREYVRKIVAAFRGRIRLETPVLSVKRNGLGVELRAGSGVAESFDHVVLATHSNQSLRMLADATDAERAILGAIPYQQNRVSLHTDPTVLPRRKRAWASWNYRVPRGEGEDATATYNMNILQSVRSRRPFCVTLNQQADLATGSVLREMDYQHPVFLKGGVAAQSRYGEIGGGRTHFCGAYWGNGFHEDGVKSALRVCQSFGETL